MNYQIDKSRIAILTTVANFELYSKTSQLFPKGVKRFVIDGTNGMHGIHSLLYMFRVLKNKNIDWLIMADEDVIFQDSAEVFQLIDAMKKNDFTVCGLRDGGLIAHRNFNPYVVNTFFSIINFKKIASIFDEHSILKNQYTIEDEFSDSINHLPYEYSETSLYEPYYCFYLWLRRRGEKFLFLEAGMPFKEDTITNSIYSINGKLLAYHSWHARSYGVNSKHTARINKLISKTKIVDSSCNSEYEIFKDKSFYFKHNIKKLLRRIKLKLGLK
jgi:hypothetical protein